MHAMFLIEVQDCKQCLWGLKDWKKEAERLPRDQNMVNGRICYPVMSKKAGLCGYPNYLIALWLR